MERRNFFKLVGTISGAAVTGSCGKSARQIIPLLVPAQEIVPGVEEWHPSVCRACPGGCGTIVRVMEAERRNGEVRERIAAIKKIEGNPLDPVSGGRLCARGQAAVQSLYHPDRLRGPMQQGRPVSWEQALDAVAARLAKADPAKIVFVTRPEASTRSATIAAFLKALGAPPAITLGLCDFTIERAAAERAFGWNGVPVYDLANADYVLGLGADFLGGWASPVYYARQFGHMRQGRAGRRGRLVHAESRFSTTAAAADEWLPVRPGAEQALALALGHALSQQLRDRPGAALFASVDFDRAARESGIAPERIRRVAHDLAGAEAPVVLAGASIVHRRSLDAVLAGNALNWLLGSLGTRVLAPAPQAFDSPRAGRLDNPEVLLLDGANPVYARPSLSLERVPLVASFSQFLDDSAARAHFILPDHDPLESSAAVVPAVAPGIAITGAPPFVRPLYDTRATEQVLTELAAKLGKPFEADSPERAFARASQADAEELMRQGGYWKEAAQRPQAKPPQSLPPLAPAEFDGDPRQFPYEFQPYPTVQFGDGSGAHLPWLQELPDAASSAMWGLPVEIDMRTAARLGVVNGDLLRIVSPHGQITAPAYVHPAALPGVVSMGIGQGHASYTSFASARGANPLAIAGGADENGAFVFAATRVRLEKAGPRGALVQFSYMDRQPETARR